MKKHVLAAVVLWCQACGDTYPSTTQGNRIAGTLTYKGEAHRTMKHPAIRVLASTAFPPVEPPNAILIGDSPDAIAALLGPGFPYELAWLPAYTYKVSAQLIDLAAQEMDYSQVPIGGYPNYCTIPRPGEGGVVVTKAAPTLGVDFSLYDAAGTSDPCTKALCPEPGRATLRVLVKTTQVPTAADRLRVAAFQTYPATIPPFLRILTGEQLVFPMVLSDNQLTPGSYELASACLDIGSNSGTGRCTAEDFEASYRSPLPPIELPVGMIVTMTADLDAHTMTVDGVDPPQLWGCP